MRPARAGHRLFIDQIKLSGQAMTRMTRRPDDSNWPIWRTVQLADLRLFRARRLQHSFERSGGRVACGQATAALACAVRAGRGRSELGSGSMPFVMAAHDDPHALRQLTNSVDAFLRNPVRQSCQPRAGTCLDQDGRAIVPHARNRDRCDMRPVTRLRPGTMRRFSARRLRALGVERQTACAPVPVRRLPRHAVGRRRVSASPALPTRSGCLDERAEDLDRTLAASMAVTVEDARTRRRSRISGRRRTIGCIRGCFRS